MHGPSRPGGPAAVGSFALVLHTHLPWLLGHGTWPVGEEWLHQAWSDSYLPVVDLLHRLGEQDYRDVLTLGVTPVLAAQLDDPTALREQHGWLGRRRLQAEELAGRRDPHLRALAAHEFRVAVDRADELERRWSRGGSAALRPLVDAGVVELLGGPATHPVGPMLPDDVARFALRTGLDDATLRTGRRPRGIWAPECAHRPGLEHLYAAAGVRHFLVDEPTLRAAGGRPDRPWLAGDSGVAVLARDLAVTDLVWSSRSGYPAGVDYRDFHTFDDASGFRPARVTDPAGGVKAPYDPDVALAAAGKDAHDFVAAVVRRLEVLARTTGQPGLVVTAYDTELFGHWWYEGPAFLEQVLRLLPEAGVRLTTAGRAVSDAADDSGRGGLERVDLPTGSWGAGKDLRLWAGEQVADLAAAGAGVARRLSAVVAAELPAGTASGRRPDLDELTREALLALSSDWAFMVSRDSAAGYARGRAAGHVERFHALADRVGTGRPPAAPPGQARTGRPFGHLDARLLHRPTHGPLPNGASTRRPSSRAGGPAP